MIMPHVGVRRQAFKDSPDGSSFARGVVLSQMMGTSFPIVTSLHWDLQVLHSPSNHLGTSARTTWLIPFYLHLLPCLSDYMVNLKPVHIQQTQPWHAGLQPKSFKNTHLKEIKLHPILTYSLTLNKMERIFQILLKPLTQVNILSNTHTWQALVHGYNLTMTTMAPVTSCWAVTPCHTLC